MRHFKVFRFRIDANINRWKYKPKIGRVIQDGKPKTANSHMHFWVGHPHLSAAARGARREASAARCPQPHLRASI